MPITHISVRGARQHNLRDINVRIPRNALTVVTGLSGSGKSSLAFDTIYAEGQRRYVETLSAYARQFLDQIERPDVDSIEGLSPAISIEQKTTSRSPRSTVGTITEIYDYLRLLYASVGTPHCPNCGRPIARQTAEQIVQRILELGRGERVTVMAPIVRGRKGEFKDLLDQLDQQGFRARVDGEIARPFRAACSRPPQEPHHRSDRRPHSAETRGRHRPRRSFAATRDGSQSRASTAPASPPSKSAWNRPSPRPCSWPTAWSWSASTHGDEQLFSSSMACPDCGLDVPKLEPRSFSFNSTFGACPKCHGLGSLYDLRPRQGHHRLVKAAARWRPWSRLCVAISAQAHPARRRPLQDRPEDCPSRICRPSSSTFSSTARPKAKRRAPASTASSPTCATTSKKRAATAIAST